MQTRLSADFVSELEGLLAEHEGDLEVNVQRSPKPGQAAPAFPAMLLHKLINQHILVRPLTPCRTAVAVFCWPVLLVIAFGDCALLICSACSIPQLGCAC